MGTLFAAIAGPLEPRPLTNYVLQAVAIYYMASRFGLGLSLRPYHYILGALAIFFALVLLSHAWLARFRYGPLEVVWRTFADLRIPAARG